MQSAGTARLHSTLREEVESRWTCGMGVGCQHVAQRKRAGTSRNGIGAEAEAEEGLLSCTMPVHPCRRCARSWSETREGHLQRRPRTCYVDSADAVRCTGHGTYGTASSRVEPVDLSVSVLAATSDRPGTWKGRGQAARESSGNAG